MKSIFSLPLTLLLLVSPLLGVSISELENLDVISPELTASDIVALASDGDRTVVAIDSTRQVLKSTDSGETWSRAGKIPSAVGTSFPRITALNYNGSVWVATGNFRSVSSDLENWDSGSIGFITSLGATYGVGRDRNGMFVAVGQSSEIRYSSDGLVWETATTPPEVGQATLADVGHDGAQFVAVSYDGHIITSPDGIQWTTSLDGIPGLSGTDDQFSGVRFLKGSWFATGRNGLLMVSDDAANWTLLDTGPDVPFVDLGKPIFRADGTYAFSFNNSARFLISDLSSFNVFDTPDGIEVYRSIQLSRSFVGVSSLGTFAYSEDGENWLTVGDSLGGNFTDVEFGDGLFFIVDDDNGKIFSSPDGRTWTLEAEVTAGTSFQGSLTKGPTGFIMRMRNNDYLYRENGTSTFELLTSDDLNRPQGAGFGTGLPLPLGNLQSTNNLWFGFDLFGDQVAYSPDLVNWTLVENLPDSNYAAVAYGDGVYALVGGNTSIYAGGYVATSTDLSTWTARNPAINAIAASFSEVTFDGSRFFTESTRPYVSSDTGSWEILSSAPSIGRRGFFQSPEIGTISFGLPNRLAINEPANAADDWDIINFPSSAAMNDGAEGNGVFVGVGDDGMILVSSLLGPDYAAWVLTNFGANPIPADINPFADPEGDGITNIEEYARGTNPNSRSQPIRLNVSNELFDPFVGDPYSATLSFDIASEVTEVLSVVEFSKDLKNWQTDGVALSESPSGSQKTVTATITGNVAAPPFFLRVAWRPAP